MASAVAPRRFFPKNQPQTLRIAVALLYWNTLLVLLSGLLGLHFAQASLLSLLANVAGAFGVANERRWGYVVALIAAFLPFVLIFAVLALGGHSYLGGGLLTLVFDLALVALLLHPMSRSYVKIWFR